MKTVLTSLLVFSFLLPWQKLNSQTFNLNNIEGFEKVGETKAYTEENLFEYINGAAEFYFTYNFEELFVASYKKGEIEITVDIYRHASPVMAFGVFSMERPPEVQKAGIGEYSYITESVLNFCKNEYYVKCNAYNIEADKLIIFAKEVAGRIPGDFGSVKQLTYFPKENYIEGSAQFIATDFLGYGFLKNALVKKYKDQGGEYLMYIIDAQTSDNALKMVSEYAEITGNGIPSVPKDGVVFKIDDPFNGVQKLVKYDRYLIGMAKSGDPDKADDYLNLIIENIKKP